MRHTYYILKGHEPVPVPMQEWAVWFEKNYRNRRVALTQGEGAEVSTVFLGLDHQYGNGPPLLFETMVFGGKKDQLQLRCSTWEQAVKQHEQVCKELWPDHVTNLADYKRTGTNGR